MYSANGTYATPSVPPMYLKGLTPGLASDINLPSIGVDAVAEMLKSMPDGDIVALLQNLPEDVVRRICQKGAVNELQQYLPWLIGGGCVLAAFFLLKK